MFTSSDNSEASRVYNSLKNRIERDSLIRKKLDEDWTHNIPASGTPPNIWVCHHFTQQFEINSHDLGDGVFTADEQLLYNGYRGNNLDSIYQNGGTLRELGKLGLPVWDVSITDSITVPSGHALVAVLTGNDLTKWTDWNIIEVQFNNMNVQPGDGRTYMPKNCKHVTFGYTYLTITPHGQKLLSYVIILEFEVVNGIPKLTFNVNDGTIPPNYYNYNPHFNEIFHVITKRDTIPPKMEIISPLENSVYSTQLPVFKYNIEDENFNKAWYSLDDGKTKTPIGKIGQVSLNLSYGDYNMLVESEDYFGLVTAKKVHFTVDNAPPKILISSPIEGTVYDNNTQLTYTITDTDFNSATYKINNGTKIPISQIGTIPLNIPNGLYKIVIEAKDAIQSSKDSVNFEMNKPVGIETLTMTNKVKVYPNPAQDYLYIDIGNLPESKLVTEIYSADGICQVKKSFNGEKEIRIGIESLCNGLYFIKINLYDLGGELKTVVKKFVKE